MALSTAQARGFIHELYRDLNGHNVSFDERERKGLGNEESLYYGEIPFDSLIGLLRAADLQSGETLYDLGAGLGQAILSASLVFDLDRASGFEILEDVHAAGAERLLDARVRLQDTEHRGQLDRVRLFQGDLKTFDWSDADVVYIAATCFSEDLIQHIQTEATRLAPTARLAVLGRKLNHPEWALKHEWFYGTSWGTSVGRVYTRSSQSN